MKRLARDTVETLKHPRQYTKAIYGAGIAGLTALGTALAPEAETGLVSVTGAEGAGIALAALTAFGTVFFANNATAPTADGPGGPS